MDIYCINGYCPDSECGTIRQVCTLYPTREKAIEALNDYIEETRESAQAAEDIKGLGNGNGIWTEQTSDIHGSQYVLKRYECSISVDLDNDDGLEMFKRMSAVGLLENKGEMNVIDGIKIDRLYTALSFNVANLTLEVKSL